MNIVISSLNSIKLTGLQTGSQDLDSAKLFIAKTISEEAIDITLKKGTETYPLIKTLSPALEKNDYLGYKLSSRIHVPDGMYTISATNISATATVELINNQELVDEDDAILVIGRNINPVMTQVVAQDINSQQLTFYIKRKYDGISFLTTEEAEEHKEVYFDYIPVDPADLPDGKAFLSDRAIVISEDIIPPNGQEGEWIMLKWNLSSIATKTAGVVKFAISVTDQFGDERSYTWQTLPSSFTVYPNLGFRTGITITPAEESVFTELVNNVRVLKDDVNAIEEFLGDQTDTDPDNDEEILFVGGGAPVDKEA